MPKLYVDEDRYASKPSSLIVESFHGAIKDVVRNKLKESGVGWKDFVFSASDDLITEEDFKKIDQQFADMGYLYDWSASISAEERPEAYKSMENMSGDLSAFSFEDPDAPQAKADAQGRELRGAGDNVVQYAKTVIGTARYIRSTQRVLDYMTNGVPEKTVAIIDDSGGTLTAPILEQFSAVICAGGTVRSHMGILAREYGVPCLMNSKVNGVFEGDLIEVEVSATAKTVDDYGRGDSVTARVWRLVKTD